jgi:molybdopterin-guanine dinucleotide biosynthesis protein A
MLTACDMPFTQPALVHEMARLALTDQTAEAIVLRGLHRLEPLHAVYRRDCLPTALERLAGADVSLLGLLATLRVHEVAPEVALRLDPSGISTFNANTPEEWQRALRLAEAQTDH